MNIQEFYGACREELFSPIRRFSWLRLIRHLLFGKPQNRVVSRLRLAQWLHSSGARGIARWVFNGLALRHGIYVGSRTEIGAGLHFPHPTSVVIGDRLILGKRCRLYQQVTLQGASADIKGLHVRLGNDVTIYPGAKVIGEGRVGNNVIIGANAVVNRPFGDDVVLAGIPARVIKRLDPLTSAVPETMK